MPWSDMVGHVSLNELATEVRDGKDRDARSGETDEAVRGV